MQSRDPSTNVVLLEDAAAVIGVIMAAGCMGLTSLTGTQRGTVQIFRLLDPVWLMNISICTVTVQREIPLLH